MGFVTVGRDPQRVRALDSADVQAISRVTSAYPIAQIFRLLVTTIYGPVRPPTAVAIGYLVAVSGIPRSIEDDAKRMVAGAVAINSIGSIEAQTFYRGLVLEAVVEGLARRRSRDVAVEEAVDGLPDPPYTQGRSKPFDVVVKDGPVELHECKTDPSWIDQQDIDAFAAAASALSADYPDVRCTITTWQSRLALTVPLKRLSIAVPVYGVALEDLSSLATRAPDQIVAAPAG